MATDAARRRQAPALPVRTARPTRDSGTRPMGHRTHGRARHRHPAGSQRIFMHDRAGISLKGTSRSTRMSPGSCSTRSAITLRRTSSVPPPIRRLGDAEEVLLEKAPRPGSCRCRGALPACSSRSTPKDAMSWIFGAPTTFSIDDSGPGVSPLLSLVRVRAWLRRSPSDWTYQSASRSRVAVLERTGTPSTSIFRARAKMSGKSRPATRSDRQSLVHQSGDRDLPAFTYLTESLRVRNANVGEEDFVEVRPARNLTDGLHLDPRRRHIDPEEGQPLVLGKSRIVTCKQDPVLRVVCSRRPDLLTVDEPIVAVPLSPRPDRGDVRAGCRLRKHLTPDVVAAYHPRE